MRPPRKHALSGFKYAQEGVLHCFRTQLHMRFHFFTLVAVLLAGLMLNLDPRDMLVLVFAVTLVIVAEMFNTAIEAIVDMITENYNPAAKLAKDVAAGAVLLAAANAVIAGVLIFFGQKKLTEIQHQIVDPNAAPNIAGVVVLGIVLLTLVVIISKLVSNTGSPWKGGIISGHSAIGFLLAMTIFFSVRNTAVAFLAIMLALLVAQSRVEAGIHSLREVVLGAVLAILLTSLLYQVMPFARQRISALFRPHVTYSIPMPSRARVIPLQFGYWDGGSDPQRVEGVIFLGTS